MKSSFTKPLAGAVDRSVRMRQQPPATNLVTNINDVAPVHCGRPS